METAAPDDGPKILISEDFKIPGTNASGYFAFCHSTPFSGKGVSLFLCIKEVKMACIGEPIVYLWISNKDGRLLGERKELKNDGIFNRINYNGFSNMCARSALYPPSPFLRDDTLIIGCHILIKLGEVLPEGMLTVITNSIFLGKVWDGCLVYSGQKQFYVEKMFLFLCSANFKNLLESNGKNAQPELIQLKNMGDYAFSEFRRLVLCRPASGFWSFDSIQDCYTLADKYKFDQLKEMCKQKLLCALTEKRLIICLSIALIYDDNELKDYSFGKLRKRFSSKSELVYFKSGEWIRFASENLSLALNIKEEIYKAVGILPMD